MNAKHAHRKTNGSSLPSLLTALALTGTLLVGCSSKQSEKQEGQITVGFSQIGAESGWRTANTQSIKSEAEKRGVDLRFSDAQGKQENQIRAIRTFIQQKVDVIAFSPVVETGWQPVLEEAKRAGIPVFLTDRAVDVTDDSLYVSFIGSDFIEEGRRAGEWLARRWTARPRSPNCRGRPVPHRRSTRKKGFEAFIAGAR